MQKFNTPATTTVAFTRGKQTLTFTVHAPPLLFNRRLQRAFPPPESEDANEKLHYWLQRSLLTAAEGLRPTEQLPPAPASNAGRDAWVEYAELLRQTFQDAGLTDKQVEALTNAATKLSEHVSDDPKDNPVKKALAAAGNA